MTDIELQIAHCAQNIINAVGATTYPPAGITSSGRTPELPPVTVARLLSPDALNHVGVNQRTQLIELVQDSLSRSRAKITREFEGAMSRLYSQKEQGLSDTTVEAYLVQAFETSYKRHIAALREASRKTLHHSVSSGGNTRGGFGDHNLLILETAFKHTTTPLSAEIDAISKLTSLEPHQFQNKRNRGNKNSKKPTTLRTASASNIPSNHLSQVDGRRVASLPSRKYVPAQPTSNRPTRGPPNRNGRLANPKAQPQSQITGGIPLSRTFSQGSEESDSTNCSYSSIPANGGFQPFVHPSSAPSVGAGEQPIFSLDPLIMAQYGPSQNRYTPGGQGENHGQGQGYSNFTFDPTSFTQTNNPYNLDLDLNLQLPTDQGDEFESYLNFNIDALAPPTDDLSSDLAAQIQAALRPTDSSFNNLTLAPSVSLSPSSQGSSYSDLSHGWFSEMTEEEVESMELLKVYLDEMGMGMAGGGMGLEGESPIEKTLDMGLGQEMMMEEMGSGSGSRSESPETVASIALRSDGGLNSGRQSPQSISESSTSTSNEIGVGGPLTITPNSMVMVESRSTFHSSSTYSSTSTSTSNNSTPPIEGDLSFIFDFEQVSNHPHSASVQHQQQDMDMEIQMGGNTGGERWMMGVLPFDMADQVMGTA